MSCAARTRIRHTARFDGLPERVRVVRARHPFQGRSLEVLGFSRRRGVLQLLLVLPDESRSLIPAAWTDLEVAGAGGGEGVLASLDDLLRARRVLEPLLARAVLAERDDRRSRIDRAAASGSGGGPGIGGGAMGAAGGGAASGGDGAAGRADRADGRGRSRGGQRR